MKCYLNDSDLRQATQQDQALEQIDNLNTFYENALFGIEPPCEILYSKDLLDEEFLTQFKQLGFKFKQFKLEDTNTLMSLPSSQDIQLIELLDKNLFILGDTPDTLDINDLPNILNIPNTPSTKLSQKEITVLSQTPADSSDIKNDKTVHREIKTVEKKKSFWSRFQRKNTDVVQEVELDVLTPHLSDRLDKDYTNLTVFKDYLIRHGYLNKKQVQQVDATLESRRSLGETCYFVQTARSLGLLNEDIAAKVLSKTLHKEVLSKNHLLEHIKRLEILNSKHLNIFRNFLVYNIDTERQVVYVVHDASVSVELYILESFYYGYQYVELLVVEGVQQEIREILEGGD